MAKAIPVNMKSNVNDFRRIEKRIAQVKAEVEADAKLTEAEKEKKFMSVLNHYTGPATGLVWDDRTCKIFVASGFHVDENGDIVKN